MSEIRFSSKAHEQFYHQMLEKCERATVIIVLSFTVSEFLKIPETMLIYGYGVLVY